MLLIDGFDCEHQSFEILVAIDVAVAYLACDQSAQSAGQSAHRQVYLGHLNRIDSPPPHSMQRPERQGRLGLCTAASGSDQLVRE